MDRLHKTVGLENVRMYIPQPDVYTKPPKHLTQNKPGQLTPNQLRDYFEKGFVVLYDFIEHKILDDVRESIGELVEDLAEKLYKAGKIKNKHKDKGLHDRLSYLDKEYPGAAVLLHKSDILPKSFQRLWSYEKLLNVVEQLIGPEISAHPGWNLRPKVPHSEQLTVPWHQDNAYFEPCSLNSLVPTAWIPFVDAHKENGCMQMVSGGHRKGLTATHTCCAGGTWYVDLDEETMMRELDVDMEKDVETCEIPYGGVLFFSNCIPHRSLENYTDSIRWSVDLRWHKTGVDTGVFGASVVLRTAADPNMEIDWEAAEKSERNKQQDMETIGRAHDDLAPYISGPWMRRWEIVNHNGHTAQGGILNVDEN